jgi:small subunit ribosomal protein S16
MVKIRLRRLGNKGRPFYRVVVAKSSAGRNGAFVETIGTYDPVSQPKKLEIKEDRALYWLLNGAEPTETTAYLLKKVGVMAQFLEARPGQAKKYKFLDKRTAPTAAVVALEAEPEVEAEVVAEAPVAEVAAEEAVA